MRAAAGALAGRLLRLAFGRRVCPVPCSLPRAEDLRDLLPVERAQPPLRRAVGVYPLDQPGKPRRGWLLPVGTQHQEPPGDGLGRKTGQRLHRWLLGEVEVVQDQQGRLVGPTGQQVGERPATGRPGLAGPSQVRCGCAEAGKCVSEGLERVGR